MEQKKILLVDDSDVIAGVLTQFFKEADYQILRAKNGVEGVEMAYHEIPDVIIMDVEMPLMQGYQASCLLKHRRGVKEIPIIMHTSLSEDKDKFWAISSGVNAFVNKDFDNLDNILAQVRTFCEHPPFDVQVIREDGKMVNKDYIFAMLGALFDQQLFASTVVNLLGEVGKSIESLPDTVSSILELLPKVCEFHTAAILIKYEKTSLAYILPSAEVFKQDVEQFYTVCQKDFFSHFPELKPEDTEQMFFGIEERTDFDESKAQTQEFRSYFCYEFQGKGEAVFGTLHIGNGSKNYFSDLIAENISIFGEAAGTILENSILFNQVAELELTRRLNERLVQMDKLKDEFLANTSHELRTPLNGIIGIAESLLDGIAGRQTPKGCKNLALISSSGKRLANLVNDILDFSKLKEHDLEIQHKPVNIKVVTDVVFTLSQPSLAGKTLELKDEIPEDIPAVSGDENRLQQILYNLLGNAIKFTESGSITVSAKVQAGMVAVSVTDTGIGIPEDKCEAIFRSFEQVDASTAREYGGTGLGLTVTKQIVELHGGTISVESEVRQGSTFTFTLPISEGVPEPAAEQRQDLAKIREVEEESEAIEIVEEEVEKTEGEFHILVVDDEPINQQVLANHLSLANYKVTQALNGMEALQAIESETHFDLVLLDIMMPKMSGYEVAQKVRKKYLAGELPIIMLTAKNQVDDLVEGFSCGANDYLAKPLSKQELLARIKTHLNLLKINSSYSRFVPHDYLRFLNKESILDVHLGDNISKEMAIMFSDIRSFTTMSEGMTPRESFDFVNAYLRRVGPAIRTYNGLIVKFLGDGIMAVFPNGAEDGIKAGIEKLRQVTEYNIHRQQDGWQPIRIGIGLHLGYIMVGIVGDTARMEGDTLSDNVNLTARLEGLTKYYGVSLLISEDMLKNLAEPDQFYIRFLDKVQVKGKEKAILVYEVFNADPDNLVERKLKTTSDFETGQQYYFDGAFAEAIGCFQNVLTINPEDTAVKLYLERATQFLVHGVPEGWQGIERRTSK